ncbi:PepSY domain-containing protein [Staphylococcus saprophyticus]|uniref:PepSY domain-containing protein n=1 Tax=Staphylococcus saprophyticus TaxID=29385 RepID=UPI002DBB00B8|nr:PepSY domain-containing protein [Staphylococcus saprophyticus]MEB7999160.1 PepSY domain-containing protein [Staphylococcus saprophyticus]
MKFKTLSILLASGIILGGCAQGNDNSDENKKQDQTEQKDKKASTNEEANSNKSSIALKDIQTTPEKAIEIAQKEYKGDVKEIAFEKEHGEWAYKIAQVNNTDESEVIIQDKDQKVANKEKESDEGDQSDKTFNYKQDVKPYKKALQKGIDEVNGGTLKEWSLEKDHGKLIYDMDILYKGDNHEVSVDAKSLKILKSEIDN